MPRINGPRKVSQYSNEFKVTAVRLSYLPDVQVKDVAEELNIHPFMLSRWRKQYRDGELEGQVKKIIDPKTTAELKRLKKLERDYARLKEEHEILNKGHPVLFRTKSEIFALIEQNREQISISAMCRVYAVTRAGYYAWKQQGPSARQKEEERLLKEIEFIHEKSGYTYGSPRVHAVLRQQGKRVSEKRIARLMRENNMRGRSANLYVSHAANHAFFQSVSNRTLGVMLDGPDQIWVGNITYLKVGDQWRYMATVMDKYTLQILGWCLGKRKGVKLTLLTLSRAIANRRPKGAVIFHSDRGIEYAAHAFRDRLKALGYIQIMNRPGKMTGNAHMKSFFYSFKSDAYHGFTFCGEQQLRRQIRTYIEFYNQERQHSALGYQSPVAFELSLTA